MENTKREFVCIVCPMGCNLTVEKDDNGEYQVSGNTCKRGEVYGKQEMIDPRRHIASTIRVRGGFLNLVPVKTDKEIPKGQIFEVMREVNNTEIDAPVKLGDVLIENVAGTGSNIVATRDIDRIDL